MRVLFWGTPEFATAAAARADRRGIRRRRRRDTARPASGAVAIHGTAVTREVIALAEGIPVLQPERPRGEEFLAEIARSSPIISVVVAYGHILPKTVIDLPRRGTLNIHASLLPALRGAAPIQAAIREGLAETGVTIMRMVPALDAGPIILQARTPILEDETYGELSLRLSELGALTLIEALSLMELGGAEERAQDERFATYAHKIDRAATWVDWNASAAQVCRLIRSSIRSRAR